MAIDKEHCPGRVNNRPKWPIYLFRSRITHAENENLEEKKNKRGRRQL